MFCVVNFTFHILNKLKQALSQFLYFCPSVTLVDKFLFAFRGKPESLIKMKFVSLFYKCVKRLHRLWNCHMSFGKIIAAVQKLAFEWLRMCFVPFSQGTGSTNFDETFILYSIHTWEAYRLLGTVIHFLETKWRLKNLLICSNGRVLCAFHKKSRLMFNVV